MPDATPKERASGIPSLSGGTNENLVLYLAGNHPKATGKMEKKYYLIEADNLRRGIAYSMNKTIAKMPSIRKQRERQS
jgi:hypothetical protein